MLVLLLLFFCFCHGMTALEVKQVQDKCSKLCKNSKQQFKCMKSCEKSLKLTPTSAATAASTTQKVDPKHIVPIIVKKMPHASSARTVARKKIVPHISRNAIVKKQVAPIAAASAVAKPKKVLVPVNHRIVKSRR